jgi:hypothetical protein
MAIAASAALAACTAHARLPEAVPLDHIECARCGMLISTEAGAGQIVSGHEDTRFYDDVGCLAADWRAHQQGATAFVRVHGGAWADVGTASFARPPAARTAMGAGLVAYATPAEATAADRQGRALTWADVIEHAGAGR